jgi:squalene cyclase
MRTLASILLTVLVSASGWGAETKDDGRAAIAKAAAYLWSKQADDGGWHSETYGLLKSGQSLTPFVLLALLDVPDAPKGAVDRALAFLRTHTNGQGELGRSDPALEDYPNFATSLACRAFRKAGKDDELLRYAGALERQQFAETGGWSPGDPAYGGWGMGGPPRKFPHAGHVDLSMTRHALEAVAHTDSHPLLNRAKRFLRRCQNADGGFMFSPVVLDANKAGTGKSTGTSTADGVLALAAMGRADEPEGRSAVGWLTKHHRADGVPGFEEGSKWRDGMLYYYLAASARAFREVKSGPDGWRKEMIRSLVARQREEGSFRNANFIMKEDDPLIATTLALLALTSATS